MLGKLLKHEFRATLRIMGPLYLVLMALSVCTNLSIHVYELSDSRMLHILGAIIMTAFGIGIVGVCVVSVVLMISRFRRNLMSDEGYVMFTLPVSIHELVWSKIIVSVAWFAATVVSVILSGIIVTFRIAYVTGFAAQLKEMFQQITAYYAMNGIAMVLEALLLAFLSCAAICLLFYASIAVGHSFTNRKALMSVVFFFIFQFATQVVGSVSAFGLADYNPFMNMGPVAVVHAGMWLAILAALIYCAVFYVITTYMLKKRLNLE